MNRRRNGNVILFDTPTQRHDWLMFVVTIALVLMLLLASHVYRDRHPSPAKQDEVAQQPVEPKAEKVLTPDPCSAPMAVWNESTKTCTEE